MAIERWTDDRLDLLADRVERNSDTISKLQDFKTELALCTKGLDDLKVEARNTREEVKDFRKENREDIQSIRSEGHEEQRATRLALFGFAGSVAVALIGALIAFALSSTGVL